MIFYDSPDDPRCQHCQYAYISGFLCLTDPPLKKVICEARESKKPFTIDYDVNLQNGRHRADDCPKLKEK